MLFFRKVGSKVKDVRTFDTQTYYLTTDGDLYSCGYNTSYNQAIPSSYEKIEPYFDKRNIT